MKPFGFKPAGVIFDLDGTLLDTEILYTEATQRVLDPFGFTYTMALKRRVMGGDSMRSAQITIDEFNLPLTAIDFLKTRESFLEVLFPDAVEISNAGDYLHKMSLGQIPMGLATSSYQHLCQLKLNKRDWRAIFSQIVCGDDTELHNSKPAPDIFLLCAKRMGIDPAQTVAFEDSRNGILAAKAAGMMVVAVASPYTTPEDLIEADLTINNYQELL